MKDTVDVLERATHLTAVEQVALDGLVLDVVEVLPLRRVANGDAKVVAAVGHRASYVRADEPGAAGDKRLRHGPSLGTGSGPLCGPLAAQTARRLRESAQPA